MPFTLSKTNLSFGGTCRLHLQCWRISQSRYRHEASINLCCVCYLLHSSFLYYLFFKTEDGGDMFFRNAVWLSTKYVTLYLRKYNLSEPPLWKLKSFKYRSQSHIATDSQSVGLSWCRTPSGAYDQQFVCLF
jgi:hypothetical protein